MLDRVRKRTFAGAITLCWALLAGGCPPDQTSTGTLVVPFELGNHRTCGDLSVKTVRAELANGMYTQEAPCMNGVVRFKDLPAGSYSVRMFGVDDKGIEVLDSLTDHALVVNVVGQDTTVVLKPAVTLTAASAHLLLRWNFGFGTCKGVGVDRFTVKVWRSGGDNLLLDASVACSTEGDGEDQYREVHDDSRQLSGDASGEVSVQPLDKTGVTVGDAVRFNFSAPGPGHDIKLSLTCEDGACKGSGRPD
jgi:hypothetical protein